MNTEGIRHWQRGAHLWWRACLTISLAVAIVPAAQAAEQIEFSENLALGPALIDPNDQAPENIATDGQGNWVVVWGSTDTLGGAVGEDQDIMVVISGDNGVTWSERAALNSNAGSDSGDDLQPTVATDGSGVWIAAWASEDDLDIGLKEDRDILFARSLDNGNTWSDPAPLNSYAASDKRNKNDEGVRDNAPHLATDGQGTWVAAWRCWGGDGSIITARSMDNGLTWGTPSVVTIRAEWAEEKYHTIAYGDGRWIIASAYPELNLYNSSDGENWSPRQVLVDCGSEGFCVRPSIATDGHDHWVLAWSQLVGNESPGDDYFDVDFFLFSTNSSDNGLTWSSPARVTSLPSHWELHSSLATNGKGDWGVVFEVKGYPWAVTGEDLDIMACTSSDLGESWTEPSIVNADALVDEVDETETSLDLRDDAPTIKAGADGRWVCTWTDQIDGVDDPPVWAQSLAIATSPGITVSPVEGLITTEDGATATFAVVLNTAPAALVTIKVSSSDLSEGTPSVEGLSFDGSNWDVEQTVIVTGAKDPDFDGDVPYTIVLEPAVSSDPDYNGLDPLDVAVTNLDNDSPQQAIVEIVSYAPTGPRNRDLEVSVHIVNEFDEPVSGAYVTADLLLDGSQDVSWSGTTGANGWVTCVKRKAESGMYETVVTSVVCDGLTWDGNTPDNQFPE